MNPIIGFPAKVVLQGVALEPGALALDAPGGRSTPCAEAPAGFDAVWTSPHAKEGRLSRRDTILLPGDRVELVDRVVRGGGGYRGDTAFRMDGPCTLRDLSLGQATLAEQRDRARRLRVGLMIGGLVALAFGIVTAVWPF